ncbi:COG3650 family protein [Tsuneonella dongtanensis]|nr:hypothetical protein [Tsuneonella dongtanensis]
MNATALALPFLALMTACSGGGSSDGLPGNPDDKAPFSAIGESETVRFTGTEPFWGGQVAGTALTYSTPEQPDGTDIAVTRFAGRGGVSWTGMHGGARFALAVTPGDCSDGMSDRTYPYVATLEVAGELRSGCAWTEDSPFTGSQAS